VCAGVRAAPAVHCNGNLAANDVDDDDDDIDNDDGDDDGGGADDTASLCRDVDNHVPRLTAVDIVVNVVIVELVVAVVVSAHCTGSFGVVGASLRCRRQCRRL
jgi:hypothetical protein